MFNSIVGVRKVPNFGLCLLDLQKCKRVSYYIKHITLRYFRDIWKLSFWLAKFFKAIGGNKMDQTLRASIQTSTFYYFMIIMVLTTISQLSTMMVIVFADIDGKESVVAASVIGPCLLGAFGIIRLLTNMTHLINDMDDDMKSSNYGSTMQSIPFPILKIIFALIFVIVAVIQLRAIY